MQRPIRTLIIAMLVLASTGAAALAAPPIVEFSELPHANSDPDKLLVGPDHNVWFTEFGDAGNAIGRAAPDGTLINEFPIPTANAGPEGITIGPDGNVWFAETGTSKLGVVEPNGTVHDFATTTSGAAPDNVISGPGGELWFTESSVNQIGRMTTAGVPNGEFAATSPASRPYDLALGPDGDIWFTERDASKIGVMDPAGTMLHEYPTNTPAANPLGIVLGPDGNMWFAEKNAIARITPTGTVAEFPTPTPNSKTVFLTVGPDKNIWFAENNTDQLGFINPSTGAIIDFPMPRTDLSVYGIASGPNCDVWVTEINNSPFGNRLAHADLGGCPTTPPAPPPAGPSSGRAKIALSSHLGQINTRTGRGTWAVTCQNVAGDECRISLSLRVKQRGKKLAARTKLVSIGSAKGTVQGGKKGKLKIQLTRKGRKLLAARKHLKVTASGKSRNRAGGTVSLSKHVTLKAKRRHPKR